MKNIFVCVKIFLIEQAREPIGIFWSFLAPVGYLAISCSGGRGNIARHYSNQIGLCLSYISMTTSLFGFGLFSTHQISDINNHCDYFYFLKNGTAKRFRNAAEFAETNGAKSLEEAFIKYVSTDID
jgi:hypothetical protein